MIRQRQRGRSPALVPAHVDILARADSWTPLGALFDSPVELLELDLVSDLIVWGLLERKGPLYRRTPPVTAPAPVPAVN